MASLFEKFSKAQATVDSNYLRPGRYLVRIDRCMEKDGRKGTNFICEFTIAHVFRDKNEITVAPAGGEVDQGPNKVGEQCGYIIAFHGNGADTAPGNLKRFVLNLLEMDESEVDQNNPEKMADLKAAYDKIIGAEQAFAGQFAEVDARTIIGQKSQKPWTKISWKGILDPARVAQTLSEEEKVRIGFVAS